MVNLLTWNLVSEDSAINILTAKKSTPGPEKPYSRDCCHTVIAMSLVLRKPVFGFPVTAARADIKTS